MLSDIRGHNSAPDSDKELRIFEALLKDFIANKQPENTRNLIEKISALSSSDYRISQNVEAEYVEPYISTQLKPVQTKEGKFKKRQVRMFFDDDFRRQQLVEGYELPSSYTFDYDLAKISQNQRKKLMECFGAHIPETFSLSIGIERERKEWKARINPFRRRMLLFGTNMKRVFDAWEFDYDNHLAELNQNAE